MHGASASASPRGGPSRRGKSPRFRADSPAQSGSSSLPTEFSNKPSATFTSSLSIQVEGAFPIESQDDTGSPQPPPIDMSQQASASAGESSKRAPRKSKTDALAALQNHAQSSSAQDDLNSHDASADYYRNAPPIPVPPALDLSSVKTTSPRVVPQQAKPRPFDLEDCPVFYPTQDEFKDPLAYVRSISDRAKNYGICKVVPPVGWKMPFVTDTENFRFKTRLQRLNSIEASSRAKVNFLEQLYRFHKQQGNPRVSVPTINHKPLDLWLLRKEVHKLGGYEAVTRGKKWSDLGRLLGYGGIPGLSTQIKNSYTRVILPYEHFCDRVRNSPSLSPSASRDPQLKTHSNIQSAGKFSRFSSSVTNGDDSSPPSSPLTSTSSPLSEPPDESEYKEASGNARTRRSTRADSQEQSTPTAKKTVSGSDLLSSPAIPTPVFHDKKDAKGTSEQNCEICHKKNRGEEMLLCDGCDCGFHMFCLDPPLTSIPKGHWFCHTCLFGTGGDFGFDEGEEHSLSSFQARDLEFRRMWFKTHPPSSSDDRDAKDPTVNRIGDVLVSEYDLEDEFWRLVQSSQETVEVEYGADVHSTTHGSAMPTMETHPLNTYSKDPWNLNNIPIVTESLLRFIKSDISGMTVPWTYVGMVFSTFCWHNEDHYTYSVNFMHWGETKTWYGIPGDDADDFEAAIKREAPDLFESQPDLLFQLVTLMNPKRLTDAGVRVYACNQRAGEFVITYPKAYHAGFNHGLNFNEAVNFALPDWLPYGQDCVARYREHRKLPVFSHDELLITITEQSQSIKTAIWLIDNLREMTSREMNNRQTARSLGLGEVVEEEDRPEDQYQCTICKVFCYLSQVTCQCTSKVACVDHHNLLCQHPTTQHVRTLRKRFSDNDLLDIQAKVAEKAAVPFAWKSKVSKVLSESARPQLRALRALVAEGDRINYVLPELVPLRKCVARANDWLESANSFLVRKQSRKRARRSRGRPPLNEPPLPEEPIERPERGLDDLYALLREVEDFGFDCPEMIALSALAQQAEETKVKALALLNNRNDTGNRDRDAYIQECERLLLHGSSLNVYLDELLEVEKIVMREQLIKELEEKLADNNLTLEEVRELVTRARACNLPSDSRRLKMLHAKRDAGEDWEERVKAMLAQSSKTIEDLDRFANVDPLIPVDPSLLDRLNSTRTKGKECERQAKAWLLAESGGTKPRVQEVLRLVARAEKDFTIPSILDVKRTADFAHDLEARCESVLKNRFEHQEEENIFAMMEKWRTYAKEHLTIFSLPIFEKFDAQLTRHYQWLESLPWYCSQHREAHGQEILDDVVESTRPEDDLPPNDEFFTCICNTSVRPPPPGTVSDAVQCDHCFARFHGVCAANGGSCPFCDHHHWNGAIHKERSWHFCYLPPMLMEAPDITKYYCEDWKQLEIIVHRVDRLSGVIGQFLSFASQPGHQRVEYIPQVRHYMRKLFKIQFAVSPSREVSFGLDLAGLHRILAGQPAPVRMKKRRRPRFTFGQDVDKDWIDGTRCICRGRTPYLLNYPTVECELCNKLYHAGCVFFPLESGSSSTNSRFMCPLCCLRKNRNYPYSEVRVKHTENHEPDIYVNTKEMLDRFSKDIVYVQMIPPYTQTLFVELIRFTPGQPDNASTNGSTSRGSMNSMPRQGVSSATPQHPRSTHGARLSPPSASVPSPFDASRSMSASGHHVPPPPWARWGNVSTPTAPPQVTHRSQPLDPRLDSPPISRKRKFADDSPTDDNVASSSQDRSPKRRMPQTPVSLPPPAGSSSRPAQVLSPSLAMMLSPSDSRTSPLPSVVSSFPAATGHPSLPKPITGSPPPHGARTVKLVVSKGK